MDFEKPRVYGRKRVRDQKLCELQFRYNDKLAHLVQSHMHPSLWFIAEGAVAEHHWIPPFDHSLREVMSGQLNCINIKF